MEQRNHRSRIGIDARQIGSFIPVTSIAGERETGRIVGTAVLFRHDVFHGDSEAQGKVALSIYVKTIAFCWILNGGDRLRPSRAGFAH